MNINELKAYSQGQSDHMARKKLKDNPYGMNTKEYTAWIQGWKSYNNLSNKQIA